MYVADYHTFVEKFTQVLSTCRFGPLRNTWCMRFESKNKELKQYTSSCFKNVPLSIAIKHQQSLCYLLAVPSGSSTSSFLYPGDEVLGGSVSNFL